MTPAQACAYLADPDNFWPDDECCYVCGELYDSLSVECDGHVFCREKCCNDYIRIARIAKEAA